MLEFASLPGAGGFNHLNKPSPSRLVFIDLVRGWALLAMIETHVFNSLLRADLKASSWFGLLTFVNGLVAPTFLFVSGWVFWIASERKLAEFRAFGPAFFSQLKRILLIWCLGYALHFPYYSYSRTRFQTTTTDWIKFYQMDILHCIAFGLLLLFVGRILVKDTRTFSRTLLPAGIAVVLLSPIIWGFQFGVSIPIPLLLYLRAASFSYFPLFPWLGFILLGSAAAAAYQKSAAEGLENKFIALLAFLGVGCIVGGTVFWEMPKWIPYASVEAGSDPSFFSVRLGCVLLLVATTWYYVSKQRIGRLLASALVVSRESLLVYVAHLLLLYRVYIDRQSLASIYRNSLSLSQCLVVTSLLILIMLVAAGSWSWLKRNFRKTSQRIAYASAVLAVFLYFLN